MMSDQNENENQVLITQQLQNNEMESLKQKVNCLLQEKINMETDFGYKRAKFKEIMLKKEEEMRIDKEQANRKIQELEDQLKHLQKELDENKSLLMVSQLQKENEIDYYKDYHKQQIGLMRSNLNEKLESIKSQYDQEVEQLKKLISDKNSNETDLLNHSLKSPQQPKNESMFTVVTKSFRQKVGALNTSGLLNSSFDDKQTTTRLNSTKEQEEEFDFLVPLEEETKMLKEKLRNTDKKLNSYEKILKILMIEFGIERICGLINACSNPDETCETVNKFREEFINKKNLESSIQLDDKDSILANLLCEQAKLRSENEKLFKRINQLVNSTSTSTQMNNNINGNTKQLTKPISNQLIAPLLNSVNKLRRTQSLISFNKTIGSNPEHNRTQTTTTSAVANDQQQSKHSPMMIKDDIHKLNKPCEMCSNYETQLQILQISESDSLKKIENYDRLLNASKQELIKEQDFRLQMEEQFIQQAKDCEQTIEKLQTKLATANHEISQLKYDFNNHRKCLTDKLEELKKINNKLKRDLINLQNENSRILGSFVEKSKVLQREAIDLPQTLEEVQFYCLKIREDLISVSIAKEKLEEDFKSQMMLLREQQKSEYLSEKRLVESLTTENKELKAKLLSAEKELNNLKFVHNEHESLLKETSTTIQGYEETMNRLKNLTAELRTAKVQLEQENADLKSKVQNLQSDLVTSEAVQKDFVKLSQSLQIELEKIRQADCEVRWQHADDITDCNNCKKFLSKKDKTHCSHCGKIYCMDCNSKIIIGGPMKNRRFKVCNVCHTLLDQTTAPYFSTVPQNPT